MKIAAISDTHTYHRKLVIPTGLDVLVHCGDITSSGELDTILDFADWMAGQDVPNKIVIAGNHDFSLDPSSSRYNAAAEQVLHQRGIHYLLDSSVTIEKVKFYGTPWVPNLQMWAFYHPGHLDRFASIPLDTDVLVSHGPPHGILDRCPQHSSMGQRTVGSVGDTRLRRRVDQMTRLKYHFFGHIHEDGGKTVTSWTDQTGRTWPTYHNAANLDARYDMKRQMPIVFDL